MIPKNELRVGNWVMTSSDSQPYLQIKYGEEIDYCAIYNNPIPITTSFLENYCIQDEVVKLKPYLLFVENVVADAYWFGIEKTMVEINSIHQLQNIYFQFIGKELTLKLNEKN